VISRLFRPGFAILATMVLAVLGSVAGGPVRAAPVHTGHLDVELVPLSATAEPGQTIYVAVRQKIAPGWHTYWRNAGDAGQATEITWKLPEGWTAGGIVWPAPKRLPTPPLMTYGYEDTVLLPVPVKVPASAKSGDRVNLAAHVDFLVCKDICVPESADLTLAVPVATGKAEPDPHFGAEVARTLSAAPKPALITATLALQGGVLKLAAAGGPLKGADVAGAYFFPFDVKTILLPPRQAIERGPSGLTLTLAPTPELLKAGALKDAVSGVLETSSGAWEITAAPGAPPPDSSGLGPVASAGDATAPPPSKGLGALALAILFGFLGGLLLNLMPCVFPVLSMKAAALAGRAHAPGEARRDGLFFLAGTLATFLVLAGFLIAGKTAGQAFGWGFQLQSPGVVAVLALLMLAIALNLSGVFEAGLSLQGVGSDLQRKPGAAGAFFTGVLAVVVGAPCTAPIMTSALGYALTAGPVQVIAVFLALGLGLALPFTALSFSPALLARAPKPGPWMDTLKHLLAFPMYATAAFMAWVFAQQSAGGAQGLLLGAGVTLALGLYLYGRFQKGRMAGQREFITLGGVGAALLATVLLGLWSTAPQPATMASEPYSAARLADLRAQGKPVFVNFTAAWCVTCKVNEQAAFASSDVASAFKRTGAVYMVGDWTKPNPAITQALSEHGRPGVPLYLVYGSGGGEPKVLPQILTSGTVVHALEDAVKPAA
jgi:thiol:disulfide interchange protein/DsbC/DsbD-like thiol-disulfide interchange protein